MYHYVQKYSESIIHLEFCELNILQESINIGIIRYRCKPYYFNRCSTMLKIYNNVYRRGIILATV